MIGGGSDVGSCSDLGFDFGSRGFFLAVLPIGLDGWRETLILVADSPPLVAFQRSLCFYFVCINDFLILPILPGYDFLIF
ncbi:hypothetical protein Hanom_Chr14g01262681 [Helianthus anomalus]